MIIQYVGGPFDGETEEMANLPSCDIKKPVVGSVGYNFGGDYREVSGLMHYALYRLNGTDAHFVGYLDLAKLR